MEMILHSTLRFTADGTEQFKDLTFVVYEEDGIHVYFDGERVDQGWEVEYDTTPQRINFTETIPAGTDVLVRRATDMREIPHVFHYTGNVKGGAEFNSRNVDDNFDKIRRGVEDAMDSFELVGINVEAALDAKEASDQAKQYAIDAEQSYQNTLAYDQQGKTWRDQAKGFAEEAESHRDAVNADATTAQLAAQQALDSEQSAETHKDAASSSAGAALQSEQNAAQSASAAQSSEQSAAQSSSTASSSASAAAASATDASASADSAWDAESAASSHATQAGGYKDLAQAWAENPTDVPVESEKYSAKHWAEKAEELVGGPYLRVSNNLSEVDPEEARDNLGLGTAATRDVVSSNTDTSGGDKVVTQGWMGLGATQGLPAPSDLNNAVENGFYCITDSTVQNAPNDGDGAMIVVGEVPATPDGNAGDIMQIATMRSGNDLWIRGADNADSNGDPNWTEWKNIMPLGVGQTWQYFSSGRASNTTYTNSTGRPIMVSIVKQSTTKGGAAYVDGNLVSYLSAADLSLAISFVVPHGSTYRVNGIDAGDWAELR